MCSEIRGLYALPRITHRDCGYDSALSSSKRRFPPSGRWEVISCTRRMSPLVRRFSFLPSIRSFDKQRPHQRNFFCADRRPALLLILKSMLVTYSSFLGSLLLPPPSTDSSARPEWERRVEWITVLAQNVMAVANDLRPVQVRRRCPTPSCLRWPAKKFVSGAREPRAHDGASIGSSEGRDEGHPRVRANYYPRRNVVG